MPYKTFKTYEEQGMTVVIIPRYEHVQNAVNWQGSESTPSHLKVQAHARH